MRGSTTRAVAGNPVLIGAATLLVVVVAVFLAYNANAGLPFVPTYQLKADVPNAGRLVKGNEVREGGYRIGQITEITPVRNGDGETFARLTMQLDEKAGPVPADSTVLIRPRSTLGLKYVDLVRGRSQELLESGSSIAASDEGIPPEFDELFTMFDEETRENSQENLRTFGGAFAGRGKDINMALGDLPELMQDLEPVMANLSAPKTQLGRFVDELEDGARISAPVRDDLAEGFVAMADTFEAMSRDPEALKETISASPPTLQVGIEELPVQRPFLRRLANISDELAGTAGEMERSLPAVNSALAAGTPVLRRTPELNEDLERALAAVEDLASSPTTNPVLEGLTATMATLNPTLRWIGPHITVCNYWTAWWTYLSDHLSEENSTGTIQRIQTKNAPNQDNDFKKMGAPYPANGENVDPVTSRAEGDPVHLHAQAYGRAVNERGEADCESGQRGYMKRLAEGVDPRFDIVVDPRIPGTQGTTYSGRPRVPKGQTFSAEPTGRAPEVGP